MKTVSIFEAKTHLSRIVESLVEGTEDGVVISRHGKPVAQVLPLTKADVAKRVGIAHGQFEVPDDIDGTNEAIVGLFHGDRDAE